MKEEHQHKHSQTPALQSE